MSDITKGFKIYEAYVNSKPMGFWGTPSEEGIKVLQDCNSALSKLGSHDLFSGSFHQTYTTVDDMVNIIQRRICRWESFLNSLGNNN